MARTCASARAGDSTRARRPVHLNDPNSQLLGWGSDEPAASHAHLP